MNAPERGNLWQRLKAVQSELIEGLGGEMGEPMAPKLERLVHTLDGLRIEDLVADGLGVGRPRQKRLEMRRWFRNTNNRSSF